MESKHPPQEAFWGFLAVPLILGIVPLSFGWYKTGLVIILLMEITAIWNWFDPIHS